MYCIYEYVHPLQHTATFVYDVFGYASLFLGSYIIYIRASLAAAARFRPQVRARLVELRLEESQQYRFLRVEHSSGLGGLGFMMLLWGCPMLKRALAGEGRGVQ